MKVPMFKFCPEVMARRHKVSRSCFAPAVLLVVCWTFLQETLGQSSLINLARGKPALQNSHWSPFVWGADNAVDGRYKANIQDNSCTHTKEVYSWHWWTVDLQALSTIRSIRITNRADCCPERLTDVIVQVSVNDPATLPGYPGPTNADVCIVITEPVPIPGPQGYACDKPINGRYVRVARRTFVSVPLILCEFEVFESNIMNERPNLALNKPASQSTTWKHFTAALTVDGNTNPYKDEGSCSHTNAMDLMHWWMVDLQDLYLIDSIRITNQVDDILERLSKFVIEISVEAPDTLEGYPDTTTASECLHQVDMVPISGSILYNCTAPLVGRYVRLVKKVTATHSPIVFCEFEVFGEEYVPTTTTMPTTPGWINGENGMWRFVYVTSQTSSKTHDDLTIHRQTANCARQLIMPHAANDGQTHFFQVEIPAGTCRYIQDLNEMNNSRSPDWAVYKLE